MPGDVVIPVQAVLGFVLTLARMSGFFIFVPVPGLKASAGTARAVLTIAVTLALFPFWPRIGSAISVGALVLWMLSETGLGVGIGLAVAFVIEAVAIAAQVIGLQAGYAYASMIDPNTQADSGILVIASQFVAGLLFFAAGLDRAVLRIFADSLIAVPPGSFALSRRAGEHLLGVASTMFSSGVRLALPVIATLAMVDISLALLGRINSHLQLLMIAFPAKMLLAITIFGWVLVLLPSIMRSDMGPALSAAKALITR